jgi:hypothetical protein
MVAVPYDTRRASLLRTRSADVIAPVERLRLRPPIRYHCRAPCCPAFPRVYGPCRYRSWGRRTRRTAQARAPRPHQARRPGPGGHRARRVACPADGGQQPAAGPARACRARQRTVGWRNWRSPCPGDATAQRLGPAARHWLPPGWRWPPAARRSPPPGPRRWLPDREWGTRSQPPRQRAVKPACPWATPHSYTSAIPGDLRQLLVPRR